MHITKLSHRISVLFVSVFLIASSCNSYSDETAFYVSPQGNDSWSGASKNRPFATLQKARDEIREMNHKK